MLLDCLLALRDLLECAALLSERRGSFCALGAGVLENVSAQERIYACWLAYRTKTFAGLGRSNKVEACFAGGGEKMCTQPRLASLRVLCLWPCSL